MKNKLFIVVAVLAVLLTAFFIFRDSTTSANSEILVNARQGDFHIEITTSGELEAKNSVRITGPNGLRAARIWQIKIEDLVDEGTIVEKGDYIASLDKSELADRINEVETELQQSLSQYTQTKLDTALELRQARDELINLEFDVEEKGLVLEQSMYEPPATIKQAEINLEKSKRAFNQAKQNYNLKTQKAVAQMQEAAAKLAEDKNEVDFFQNLVKQFVITAPEAGMVIYEREYDGRKREKGATIGAWDPTVATLPDLTTMISRTYINEVEIRKVKTGQKVKIGLDAFPEKKLTGEVIDVANVGEQQPNSDAKVFEVTIQVNESDTTLRPAMTTSNTIIAEVIENVVFIPLECLHNQGDSLTYVFKKEGINIVRQEISIGKANANEVIIHAGIAEGDDLFLSVPNDPDNKELVLLNPKSQNISAAE